MFDAILAEYRAFFGFLQHSNLSLTTPKVSTSFSEGQIKDKIMVDLIFQGHLKSLCVLFNRDNDSANV